jgi:flavodoxin
MKKAIIIYQSKKGTTKQFSYKIADYLRSKTIKSKVASVEDLNETDLSTYDYIFLGCWTKGLMFFAQHPDAQWQKIVKSLKLPDNAKITLFTTYKIFTGTMFSKMINCISKEQGENILQIKSRNASIPAKMMTLLEDFIK